LEILKMTKNESLQALWKIKQIYNQVKLTN
jgi:hypothetical protein